MRCKMTLRSIVREVDDVASLSFFPVCHEDDPDRASSGFCAATPEGELKLNVANADDVNGLEIGGEYYVDIVKAKKAKKASDL